MTYVTNELLSRAAAALFMSAVAYTNVRWRRNFAMANTRLSLRMRTHRARILRFLARPSASYEFNLALCSFAAFLAALASLALWAFFCVAVVQLRRGTLAPIGRLPAPEAATPGAGAVLTAVLAIVGFGLCACGIYLLRNRTKLATFYRWLHDVRIPAGAEYTVDGSEPAKRVAARWRLFLGALGVVLIATGLGMMLIALAPSP